MKIYEYRGARNLVYAELQKDETGDGGLTYGTVKPLAGLSEIGKNTESSSETKYYDDVPAIVVESTGKDEVTLNVSAIPLDILADITGQFYDETTGTLVEGERQTKYFAIGYVTEKTNGEEIYVWRYKGTFAIPESNHKTKDDSTDSEGQEITYTGINTTHRFKKTGKTAKAINVDLGEGKADTEGFFESVKLLDELQAKTTPSV